jgi:two-component system sensor histidine kinase QseC
LVTQNGNPVDLSTYEYRTLVVLLERQGRLVTREDVEDAVYGSSGTIESNTIAVFVHNLRRKLGEDIIATVRGCGYRIGEVALTIRKYVGNWDLSKRLKSLRGRLWLGLSVTVIVFWCLIFTAGFLMAGASASPWDASLEPFAQILLAGLPSSTSTGLYSPAIEASEPRSPAVASPRPNEPNFQIWVNHRLIMRSRNAPSTPLKPDFRPGIGDHAIGGELWRVYDLADSTGSTHVQVGRSPRELKADILHAASIWVTVTTLLLALPGAAVWLVIRWSFAPVDAMRDLMQQRKPFDLMPLRQEKIPSEVQTLVDSFNRILEQLNSAIQAERRFIADAAHELRTPLALLAANAQVALRADTRQEREAALRRLSTGVERSTRLSEQLLDLAQLDSSEHVTAHPTSEHL